MEAEVEHDGGINHERSARRRQVDAWRSLAMDAKAPGPVVTSIRSEPNTSTAVVIGRNFKPWSQAYVGGAWRDTRYVNAEELRVSLPEHKECGDGLVVSDYAARPILRDPADTQGVVIRDIRVPAQIPVGTNREFPLLVEFTSGKDAVKILSLELSFPDGETRRGCYRVSSEESQCGFKLLEGFVTGIGGEIVARAALYDDGGHADYLERAIAAVPSNPLQLYVYAQDNSLTGRGAAEYRGGENRYYCEARWVISNGNPYAVTVGPQVRCRTSDAGLGQLDDFTFNIGTTSIPANSSVTLYVYTWHGSGGTYDLFRQYEDMTFRYTLQTSTGDIESSLVWIAMGRVQVTANFVGSFSSAEVTTVRDICENRAAAFYAQVDCMFGRDTPILFLPSSSPDWERFRDISVGPTKSGVCTDSPEAADLRAGWSAPAEFEDRIDIFFVESFSGDPCASSVGGFSPRPGPASKDGGSSGVVIDVKDLDPVNSVDGADFLGLAIAHEAGHYLGLPHSTLPNNFMQATGSSSNTIVTYDQWVTMRSHGFVHRQNP